MKDAGDVNDADMTVSLLWLFWFGVSFVAVADVVADAVADEDDIV